MKITCKWNDKTGETTITQSKDFNDMPPVAKADFLRDVLHDINRLYHEAMKNLF